VVDIVKEASYVEQEHVADHVIRMGYADVVLEGEACVYSGGVSTSELVPW